ncbi:autotransporter-associated beta strand repeat-containing protein, partial [Brucella anthropi]|uniref:autotransporter-associated beta strand repeat-containing protein n=1 Tax=Brucella anthropi TaxID=529 RepID=UPI0030815B77
GMLTKTGTGTLVLSGDSRAFTRETRVDDGLLRFDGGSLGGFVTVNAGASLGGSGKVSGGVLIDDGGALLGQSGQKLSFNGLNLAAGSQVDVTLTGAPSDDAFFDVHGDLALNGTLNIAPGSVVG